jgi:hypothetical protein
MEIPADLVQNHRHRRVILFAGAGVSRTLGVPLLDVVVKRLAEDLHLTPDQADVAGFRTLSEYYELTRKGDIDEFYRWMDGVFHPDLDIRTSEIHKRIIDLNFPIIYTTNYDRWIERAFAAHKKPYRKIVTVSDWADSSPEETQIIKFHGDFDEASSIVLTESSFFSRMMFEKPLDIRLRSDSLARPFLFLGYSVRDPNIRFLLYRLSELWENHDSRDRRPKSFIVMSEHDPVQERLFVQRGVEPIVVEGKDPAEGLRRFLAAFADASFAVNA